jgi:hypothetical protein
MMIDELQAMLVQTLETALDARDLVEGEDDDTELADLMRDIASDADGISQVIAYPDTDLMTRDAGLVVRMADGSEYQITIVQSRAAGD